MNKSIVNHLYDLIRYSGEEVQHFETEIEFDGQTYSVDCDCTRTLTNERGGSYEGEFEQITSCTAAEVNVKVFYCDDENNEVFLETSVIETLLKNKLIN